MMVMVLITPILLHSCFSSHMVDGNILRCIILANNHKHGNPAYYDKHITPITTITHHNIIDFQR